MTQASSSSSNVSSTHVPVMQTGMITALAPQENEIFVDGTFGAGGYTRAILMESPGTRVIAFDRDPQARARYEAMPDDLRSRITFVDAPFSRLGDEIIARKLGPVDGVVLDLGVSSPQIDDPARGFSFRFDGPLDMRMDPRCGPNAADIVNQTSENDLANILYTYGEEKKSRAIARAIVTRRSEKIFERTKDLADVIRSVIHQNPRDPQDPATRSFQALRLYVNNELDELRAALMAALQILRAGGRLVVVTFHSLEDRIVKQFFRQYSGGDARPSRFVPETLSSPSVLLSLPSSRAQAVSANEAAQNPRARSAHLRVAIRTDLPFHDQEGA